MSLTIFGRSPSINVRKVLWTADELGLAYACEDWGGDGLKSPEHLALNPNGQMPVIRDGDLVLWESHAIMRYLNEKHSGALLPGNGEARALAEQWLGWAATDLNMAWAYAFIGLVRKAPGFDDAAQIALSQTRWVARMRILEDQLGKTRAYAAGDAFSLADIALGLAVHRWFGTPIERPDLPNVSAYYERLRARPAAVAHFDPALP